MANAKVENSTPSKPKSPNQRTMTEKIIEELLIQLAQKADVENSTPLNPKSPIERTMTELIIEDLLI